MTMTVTARAALGCLLVLAGAGCGGDDGGGDGGGEDAGGTDRDAYQAALVSTMEGDDEFPEDRRDCVAGALIDAVGFEALSAAVTPDEIREQGSSFDPVESGIEATPEQGEAYYEGLSGCLDVRELLAEGIAEDLDDEGVACVGEALTDDVARVFVVTSFTGEDPAATEPELMQEFQDAVTPCLGAE